MTDSELRAFLTFAESIDSPETEELIFYGGRRTGARHTWARIAQPY